MSLVIENGWPRTAAWTGGELHIGGIGVRELAAEFGTPAYVLDEAEFQARCAEWRDALPGGEVHYGGKAFLCPEVVRWLDAAGLCLDVCTGGELAVAVAGGMDPARVVFHGNNKSVAELRRAVTWGVGCVVVDSFAEIERLALLAGEAGVRQRVMIRVTPGVKAHTHEFIATGGDDSKFGFSLNAGLAAEAVRRVLAAASLELTGLHSHIGSQITDLGGFTLAARRMADFLQACEREHGVTIPKIDLGGGLGIVYRPGDPVPPSPAEVVAALREAVPARVRLAVEPGRSIVGPTGVALYEVGTVKEIPGVNTYVSVDGGMSDNPRPAMYGAAYTALLASRSSDAPSRKVTVVGKHCESGDVLIRDLPLPADVRPGDLLAIPASGAYQRSMASNYNHVTRPPVVAVRDGAAKVIVRRETEEDLLRLYLC
ncbi:diaminopimelate decarboxylase [Streptosporangium sp. NBC_01639]|uniref:diaminopimelate decarboxylase n=1 Tax=unclassified Streptosporangium TaxID=2632669 RepID=UPI002DDC3819|nr:diaminopimelate decarboxylase [Streptosporangium sp. NBC_01756]WSC86806.1 diaminopimelate decarboxylase [Streptosporangium sp. NBC_01756]WTD54469.1 diaminopimelate decarboxylase [Streptosporangium sp. NBC_01639]